MNQTQFLIIYWSIYAVVIILLMAWMRKNNVMVNVSRWGDGVLEARSTRSRVGKDKLIYSMFDLFGRNPLIVDHQYKITTESVPFVGIKYTLFLMYDGKDYHPVEIDDDNLNLPLDSNIISIVNMARTELYENTKPELGMREVLNNFVLPMGTILLAICCLLFFPKIYDAIMEQSTAVAKTAISGWSEAVKGYIPFN